MTRRLKIAFGLLLLTSAAHAVAPQTWKVDTAEEFLAGELDGFAVSARGELTPGPRIVKVTDVSDPFVLSQTHDGRGTYFIGTGNSGNLYRLKGKSLELIHKVPEAEIYAVAWVKGTLVVGSSPNGKLYAVDPSNGAARELFDPQEAYIWCIEPMSDGSILVGTGVEGRVYKVTLDGKGSVFFDGPDTHVRSLEVAGSRILAGTAGSTGRIYELSPSGTGRALYESSFSEISAIEADATGMIWAAGVTTVLPTTAPARAAQSKQQGSQSAQGSQGDEEGTEAATVDVTFSFESGQTPTQAARVGASELYRVERDGFVAGVRRFDREIVYALRASGADSVDIATGPAGRIYRHSSGELELLATVPEKQIVTLAGSDRVMVTTTNSGAVHELETKRPERIEVRAKAGDTGGFSRFGAYAIEGRGLEKGGLLVSFRSGNTSTPDDTWSPWQTPLEGVDGAINAPPARYLQWRVEATSPSSTLSIDSVSCAYVNRNVAPQIENLTLHDPGVVFVSAAYPSSPQVLEATNPDEYGIFNSLDKPSGRNDPGKRLFRKSYRTVTWRVTDENGDSLRYKVEFRPEGDGPWLRLRENMIDSNLNFDTAQLPDGRYEIRLVASDEPANPGKGLETVRDDLILTVDNSSPVISSTNAGDTVDVIVRDELSIIVKAEYSIDAQEWIQIVPTEGLSDSREERYQLEKKAISGKLVIFRAVDAQYNVSTASIPDR